MLDENTVEALKEWQEEWENEVKKVEKEKLINQKLVITKKLAILKNMKIRIKDDPWSKKVLEKEIEKLEQVSEEKEMQSGRLNLLKKLVDHLEDII